MQSNSENIRGVKFSKVFLNHFTEAKYLFTWNVMACL